MGHTFGIFSKSVGNVTFGKMRSSLVEGAFHPNHPDNPDSPNRPRAEDRYAGYQNPLLGDPGKGQIGRWQTVNLDSLESVIDQMIEQFVRDKNWYAKVRCREALWNMYRRLEWWVNQQIDPQKNDYQRALLMVRDCIYKILKNAEQPDGTHQNVSLPVCPAPYYHHFSGYYLNHYDAIDKEVPTFDMRTLPLSDKFHGLFRYVSSTEDQEWTMVHSVGTNEMAGNENIMKLDVSTLKHGNSSKVTFQWRFKKQGFIRFKYMASTAPGDGLLFFINNNQVGGEWNQNSSWQEAKFHVKPGQTYKFDWFVRRMSDRRFGKNAVYVKDVECVEVVQSLDEQTPPDVDTLFQEAYQQVGWQWITKSSESKIMTNFFGGVTTTTNNVREYNIKLDNECDGIFSFSHKLGGYTPPYRFDINTFFVDSFHEHSESGSAPHQSKVDSSHDLEWTLHPNRYSQTTDNSANSVYIANVGDESMVEINGKVELICPPLEVDHHQPKTVADIDDGTTSFSFYGVNIWRNWLNPKNDRKTLVMEDPIIQGTGDATTTITINDDGWFEFDYHCNFRGSESFEVLVDGEQALYSLSTDDIRSVKIPLTKGTHSITFRVSDSFTELPFIDDKSANFDYDDDHEKIRGRFGSYITVDRDRDWDYSDRQNIAFTESDHAEIQYNISLKPGATLDFSENLTFEPTTNRNDFQYYKKIWSEEFNEGNGKWSSDLDVRDNWEWVDIYQLYHPDSATGDIDDGVLMVKDKDGTTNRIFLREFRLRRPGYVRFEYGGKYSKYEALKLYDNGKLIWEGNQNHESAVGIYETVILPAGNHELTWVYQDYDEVEIEVGSGSDGTEELTPDEAEESCFPSGNAASELRYDIYDGGLPNTRKAKLTWKGHSQSTNSGNVNREITAPSYSTFSYKENLLVYGGTGIPHTSVVKPTLDYYDSLTYGWPAVLPKLIPVPHRSYFSIGFYHGGGDLTISFKAAALLRGTNSSGYEATHTGPRGIFSVHLTTRPHDYNGELLFITTDNVGRGGVGNIDWSKAQPISRTLNKPAGKYYITLSFLDFFNDTNMALDKYQYGAINYLFIQTSSLKNTGIGTYDDSKVLMEVIDKSTNKIIQSKEYKGGGTTTSNYLSYPININIPPGKTYQIRYTLVKGKGTTGGLSGKGGSFALKEGTFSEKWVPYCCDSTGHCYPKKDSPHTGSPPTPPETDWIIPDDSWCWIDHIEIWESPKAVELCKNTRLRVRIYDEDSGDLISEEDYTGEKEQEITASFKNTSSDVKNYSIKYRYYSDCGDKATLYDAQVKISDSKPVEPSSCTVFGFKVTENTSIWMGGCNGSKMYLNVYAQDGKLIHSQTFLEEGEQSFAVNSLLPTPSPSYRFEFITEQKGTTSAVTGKEYKTTFRIKEFQATETWELVPEPFNSKLEFYIDNILMDTFTQQGGFYDHYYPVEAGKHTYKWKFIAQSSGQVWDACEIDYIKLTNWICDKVLVTPYCDPGSGDKCVEALIKCLLAIWKQRPEACVIGKRIWLFT
ncbi:hypothetical protein [Brevibacillus sp. HB2.2]|uniref:hypothetical protein n=1 Tax=Brevibacillus sp. HB2.2 TaxID=2738846 RepID=UPI00156AD534|nr:hypothetical protein [Brevibacillus sp. HB2.2]NRS50288.1 hypothetical protein [Brevibacillus sp. HB2.2]